MNDPNVVVVAPKVSALVRSAVGSEEGLSDRARGVMLGLAAGNLLGLPMEGWPYREIDQWYPDGVRDIDAARRSCRWTTTWLRRWIWERRCWREETMSMSSADGSSSGGVRTVEELGLPQTVS